MFFGELSIDHHDDDDDDDDDRHAVLLGFVTPQAFKILNPSLSCLVHLQENVGTPNEIIYVYHNYHQNFWDWQRFAWNESNDGFFSKIYTSSNEHPPFPIVNIKTYIYFHLELSIARLEDNSQSNFHRSFFELPGISALWLSPCSSQLCKACGGHWD